MLKIMKKNCSIGKNKPILENQKSIRIATYKFYILKNPALLLIILLNNPIPYSTFIFYHAISYKEKNSK